MVDKGIKITGALVWALVLFLVSAVIEAFITTWVFRRYGGCPFKKNKILKKAR